MEFLRQLDAQEEFNAMCAMLQTSSNVAGLYEMFEGHNPKVLLSSFMIKNFCDMFPTHLVQEARVVTKIIFENKIKSSQKNLKHFEKVFSEWKFQDLENLKNSITLKKFQMESLAVHEMDEADRQWNEGVELSIKTMGESLKLLDSFASSRRASI